MSLDDLLDTAKLPPRQPLKARLHSFLEGTVFNLLIAVLIILSVTLIFAEFILGMDMPLEMAGVKLTLLELSEIITAIFVIELSLRFYAAPNKRIYFSNYWIDIISVIPLFRVLRAFRLLRLLRLLRLTRAVTILRIKSGWLSRGLERWLGSFALLFFTTLMLIISGSLAFLSIEDHTGLQGASFDSVLDKILMSSFLFVSGELVTDSTLSPVAKLIAVSVSIAGLIVFAVMVGTITASMTAYFRGKMEAKDINITDLRAHLIVCGWDRMGATILRELESATDLWQQGVVVIAETDTDIARESRLSSTSRFFHIQEDFTKMEVLDHVGARYAQAAIVLADKGKNLGDQDRDARTVLAALTLEKLNPSIFTVAELLDEQNAEHLRIAGVEQIISRTNITAGLFASNIINRGITSIVSDLLTPREGSYIRKIPAPTELVGRTILDCVAELKQRLNATLLAIECRDASGSVKQAINPPPAQILDHSDSLILVVNKG